MNQIRIASQGTLLNFNMCNHDLHSCIAMQATQEDDELALWDWNLVIGSDTGHTKISAGGAAALAEFPPVP